MCDKPLIGIKYGVDSSTGKWKIKLKRRLDFSYSDYCNRYGKENVILIPCGHCPSCILARRKEWAVRCSAEASFHEKNCFITLTYDDLHLPGSLDQVKIDLKKFIKSVRNSGFKIRYFGCGERGELYGRLHAHIILFGWIPDDIYYIGVSDSGDALYTSDFVDKLWNKGRCTVQFFGESVGAYVAGYTSKKLGEKYGFQIQSTRPGIGYNFAVHHANVSLKYDTIFGSFGQYKVPRYFEKIYESLGYGFYLDYLKTERASDSLAIKYAEARDHGFVRLDDQIFYSRSFNLYKLSKKVRNLC